MNNIMIVGVGGQGTLLTSRVLGNALLSHGFDVKISEVHGMSQRGGSVVTYVRFGEEVASPVISKGEADIILAFEELEAARWLPYLKKGGRMIVNTQKLDPMPVIIGAAEYPEKLIEKIAAKSVDILPVDALKTALQAGNAKAVNIVLVGILSTLLNLEESVWLETIKATVPEKFLNINLTAFALGRAIERN